MMKSPDAWALAVRLPGGGIHVERHQETALSKKYAWARWPLVRGIVALYDSMAVSYQAMSRSAALAGEEQEQMSKGALYGTMAVSLLIGIGMFIVLPGFLSGLVINAGNHPVFYNLFAGLIKAAVLVGYLLFIGRLPDIQRFFMYHGAEHKAIAAYEKNLPLTVENVRAQPAFHPRCGTTFITFVILASVVVYSLIPHPEVLLWRLGARVLFLPLVAGLAFELLRWSSSHSDPISNVLKAIGFRFQMLTVKEPTDDMIEVAIESTRAASEQAITKPVALV
ncbi:MAG: DUF1385 domain-containing protein [Thermaceae bacterium]|nr:DUF1385 domain-containing protein [Thermaceae bacterium]